METIVASPLVAAAAGFLIGGITISSLNGKGPSAGAAGIILVVLSVVVATLGGLSLSLLRSILPASLLVFLGQIATFAAAFVVAAIVQAFH